MKRGLILLAVVIGLSPIVGWLSLFPLHVEAQAGLLTVVTPATVTCDSATHAFSATSVTARMIQIIPAATGNSGPIRIGDSSVGSSRGWPVAGGGAMMLPSAAIDAREASSQHFYDLSTLYYYCAASDTFAWGYVK